MRRAQEQGVGEMPPKGGKRVGAVRRGERRGAEGEDGATLLNIFEH